MHRIQELQSHRNTETRAGWEAFRTHREHVTKLLTAASATQPSRLCILGAGNCNDLALSELLKVFSEIHLVDLDSEAMEIGLERQGLANSQSVFRHGMDVTGVAAQLAQWTSANPASDSSINECLTDLQVFQLNSLAGDFHVVASVCLLSQLIDIINLALGEHHPRFVEVMSAVRLQHFQMMLRLTAPGGVACLVTDVVSSVTCPDLNNTSQQQLPHILLKAISARNFFTGLNPLVLHRLVQTEPTLAPQVQTVTLTEPWIWDLGPRRYAVCALVMRHI